MRILLTIILFTLSCLSYGQVNLAKRALKQLEKGDVDKAISINQKSITKDSTLAAGFYVQSRIFFTPSYPQYSIDSAYHFILMAINNFEALDEKERKKHEQAGINPDVMEHLKQSIDSAAFVRATERDTETAYNYFINTFNSAQQLPEAISLRNTRAFEKAIKENSYQSYKLFMEKYPEASQVKEAKKRYENLYFYERTADNTLASYQQFLRDNPDTPHRPEAERNIYAFMTADNSASSYQKFINLFPKSKLKSKAVDFLYHVLKESEKNLPSHLLNDSINNVKQLEGKMLVPYRQAGLYGFMDSEGIEIIPAKYEKVHEDELCGGITRDFVLLGDQVAGLNQVPIYNGPYDLAEDLGYGLLKIVNNGKAGVFHKSGRKILPLSYEEVKLLQGKFLAFKKGSVWGLTTVSGKEITGADFNEISSAGTFILFEKGDLIDIKNEHALIKSIDNGQLKIHPHYNDFELLEDGNLWLQSGSMQKVIDKQGNEIIPLSPQKIKMIKNGLLVEKGESTTILNNNYDQLFSFSNTAKIYISKSWAGIKKDGQWSLFDINNKSVKAQSLDSLELLGNHFALIIRNDSIAIVTLEKPVLLEKNERVVLLSESNSEQYLMIEDERRRKKILSKSGEVIFNGKFDEAKPLGPDYIVISQGGKKGLISANSQTLLPLNYDAIGNYQNGYVALLKNKKFGLYNQHRSIFIQAEYEKNLAHYNDYLFIAEKDGNLGIVTGQNKRVSGFEYQDITFWSDTVALVKKDNWHFYDLQKGEVKEQTLRSVSISSKTDKEITAIVLTQTGYGLRSNRRGEIISPTFNDIVNVGTDDRPVYFTEKHIHEAEFYIVIYFNAGGNIIRKQAFEAKEYPLIYCDN